MYKNNSIYFGNFFHLIEKFKNKLRLFSEKSWNWISWLFNINEPKKYKLPEGTWIKAIDQLDGNTYIIFTDGCTDTIWRFKTDKVTIKDDVVIVG